MKKLLLFVLVTVAFAACEQAPIEEAQGVVMSDRSLEVSFEGADDTRIQLQNGKTVWTKGDHVSVFYRSTVNEEWQFMGETGDRTGQIEPVDNSVNPPATHNHVVVVYPYSEDYFYNTDTHNVEASLPAVQNYLKDSYGTNGNIMISSSEFNKVSLKSVCGWLKLQLTGDGEVVKSITLRGNDGEQVAGLIYVDSAAATATLASASGEAGDGEVGGTLVRPGTILTEVILDCGEGVTLDAEATAFYIALPPQTFEQGFTVEIEDTDGNVMEQSTDKTLLIERNTIKPMAAFEFINPNSPTQPTQPTPASNEIWYTATEKADPYFDDFLTFGSDVVSNVWDSETKRGIITFDGDVTMIGDDAFNNCDKFTGITLPESVTSIGKNAFYDCDGLTEFIIPDSVTTIGNYAFAYCTSLTSVTIGDSVTTIGNYAFYDCNKLTSVTIGDSVTTIGERAFQDCRSLTSVTIPDSVTTIGNNTFQECYSLTSVTIGDSVTAIGKYTFGWCNSLTSVTIGDSVTTIGEDAFYECTSLTSVTIPDSVTTIGYAAFDNCGSLTSVTIPDSVTTIGERAFYGCSSLQEFKGKFASEDGRYLIIDGVLNSFAIGCGATEYTIPDSVTTIGGGAFAYCTSLTSVTIGDSVITIGGGAFSGCSSLKKVYCYATTPPALGNNAFNANASARRIYVYEECVELYKSAWSDYKDSIYTNGQNYPDTTTIVYTTNDGNTITSSKLPIISNIYDNGVGTMIIGGIITEITGDAFRNCSNLTSITIPDSVTTIEGSAFAYCENLTSVTIPDSVTTIGDAAFRNCSSLTSVTIPDSVTEIGWNAFYECTSLTSVTIGNSVTTIGDNAFWGCDSLTSVTIPDSVTTIGKYVFSSCDSLTSVYCKATTPPSVTLSIYGFWGTFDYNASGRKIYVPMESVEAYKSASGWKAYASSIEGYNF